MNNNNFIEDASALQRPQISLAERKATVGKLSLFLEDYMVGDPHRTMKALEMASRFEQRIYDTTSTREQYLGMIASRMQYIQMRKQNLPGELETPALSVHPTEGEKSAIRQLLTANEPWLQRMSQLLANFSKSIPNNNSEILSRYESYRRLLNRQCEMVLRENTYTMNYQGIRNLIDHIQRMTSVLEAKIQSMSPTTNEVQQQRKGSFEKERHHRSDSTQQSTKISSIPTEYEDELLKRLLEGNIDEDFASKSIEAPIRTDMSAIGIAILRKEIELIRSRYDCFDAIFLDTFYPPQTRILLKLKSSEWTCLAVPDDYPSASGFQVIFGGKEFSAEDNKVLMRLGVPPAEMEDRLAEVICKFHALANTIYSLEDGGRHQVQTLLEEIVDQLHGLDEHLQSPQSPKTLIPTNLLTAIDQGRHPDTQWFLQDQLEDPDRGLFAAHRRVLGKASALWQFRQLLLKEAIGDEVAAGNSSAKQSGEEVLNITD